MKTSHFNGNFLTPLLDKILKEEKTCLLMGSFNVNLLNNENKFEISEFCYHISLPHIPLANKNRKNILKLLLTIYFKLYRIQLVF